MDRQIGRDARYGKGRAHGGDPADMHHSGSEYPQIIRVQFLMIVYHISQ
jgi:hypothetical protein